MSLHVGSVFYISLVILLGFVTIGVVMPAELGIWATEALHFTTQNFGWMYLFVTTGFLLLGLRMALSSYGHIRLGVEGEAPEFSYSSWLGMIFSAGMGIGLVFWGVAEPMTHYMQPPLGAAEAATPEAARLAMRYTFFHWGFHQWANFGIVGLAIAYVRFRLNRPGVISEAFRSTLGDRVDGIIGKAIDVLAVVSTVFGVATTLGLGMIQVNSGMDSVFGMPFSTTSQLMILAGVAVIFLLCSLAPLEGGIRYVSDANMLLAAGLLLFVFFFGPTSFITAAMTNAIGDYFNNVIGMSLAMAPYTQDQWVENWTIFYWAWGLSWAPFVGSFIARISRGRTIREFVLGVIGMPVVLSVLWISTFGGSALYYELFEGAGLGHIVSWEISSGLFVLLEHLPGTDVVSVLMLVLTVLFVVTSANSATFVLGMFTGKGVLVPSRPLRLTWGVVQVLVAAVLLIGGGLKALQTISVVAALPFMILMIFMAFALHKSLRDEKRQKELHDAIMRERMQRYFEKHEQEEQEEAEDAEVREFVEELNSYPQAPPPSSK